MRKTLTAAALLLSLLASATTAPGQNKTCSCTAPDQSCTPIIECPHGCTSLCGSNDACFTACRSVQTDGWHAGRIKVNFDKRPGEEIAAELSRLSRRRIKFIPDVKDEPLSFALDNGPLWDALEFLDRSGKVFVDKTPFENLKKLREKMKRGERVAIYLNNIPVAEAVDTLSFVSGLPFRVTSGNARKAFSIDLKEATLPEIISGIAARAKVKIKQGEESASAN